MSRRAATCLLAAALLAGCGGSSSGGGASGGGGAPDAAADTGGAAGSSARSVPPCPELPRVAPREDGLPPLRLDCLGEGPAVRLSDLRGTPTVLNVWAAWCTNCDREMPLFAQVQERAGDRLRFLGVHYKAPRGYALRSEVDFGVPFPSVHDEDGDRVVRALDAYAPPQTLFVTAEGRVAGRKVGEISSTDELSGLVEKYLRVTL
ncbi:MAG: TlpA family protein disulfide reductase [Actinomycetes bacterium]